MTEETRREMPPIGLGEPAIEGHYTAEGRNIIPAGRGHDGHDIFYAAVQMSRMPMCLSDPNRPDNPLVFCNSAFERLSGYPSAAVIGRNCRFLQGPATDREAVTRIAEGIAARRDVHEELFNYRADGTGFWNALFISPVYGPNGELLYFFASQLDVTRRREAELVLQQSQRMETLGAMASALAHEFNNLMTVVVGSIEQAKRDAVAPRQRERLGRADWGARRAGKLTQQMLSFARRQFHDNRPVDLNTVLRSFDALLDQMAGEDVSIAFALSGEEMPVSLDVGQLELALLNLIRNAAEAVAATDRAPPHVVTVGTLIPEPGAVGVFVRDDGVGMQPEVRRLATEPFFTTKDRSRGSGLGLSMVHGFVLQSGGRLDIRSEPGLGTTMTMIFPRRHERAGGSAV